MVWATCRPADDHDADGDPGSGLFAVRLMLMMLAVVLMLMMLVVVRGLGYLPSS